MNGKLIEIRGKEIYVEVHGKNNKCPVLYLHGGPGESCYDFSYHQAKSLSEFVKLIAIDQRGVCRSELIEDNDAFGLDDIIEDCEELRKILGIERWSLIGHSFGGYVALKYAYKYPSSISKIIFEGPTFDFRLTTISLLEKTAQIAEKHDIQNISEECLSLAKSNKSTKELVEGYLDLSYYLCEKRMEIYTHNFSNQTDYSVYSQEEWNNFDYNAEVHYDRLRDEGTIYETLLPLIKEIQSPMLLLRGKYDPVTCQKQIDAFKKNARYWKIFIFNNSGHTPHYEESKLFSKVVINYLLDKPLK
ncbi:alpha/beta fold hydrolase [Neobacillus terrae]|uniref:alpha/beta fold hydrolase n=1 Tax=Neobacillus terrae TaxID=3034837 RepID=UPI00140DA8D3|nr:alpha/beta hydrolase [Neobacillus terrae]NHM30872.1 alpha/beta hydrolase [Neobacillus terrae]